MTEKTTINAQNQSQGSVENHAYAGSNRDPNVLKYNYSPINPRSEEKREQECDSKKRKTSFDRLTSRRTGVEEERMFARSIITPDHLGLLIGAERVRKIRPRTGRLTMPGWFPTRKGTQLSLRTESTLEIDGLAHFEINPDCVLMATQPHHLIYDEPQPEGGSIRRKYTPDVVARMSNDDIVAVDFKPAKYASQPKWQLREKILRVAYARDHGVIFRTITEEQIKLEPRHSNVKLMLMHRRIVADPDADVAMRSAVLRSGLPSTIGQLCAAVILPSTQPHVDRAFTAVIEMALHGEVALDLGIPLGPETVVTSARIAGSARQ